MRDTTFELAGVAGVRSSGISAHKWGEAGSLRYSVSESAITFVSPQGKEFVFKTLESDVHFPFRNNAEYYELDPETGVRGQRLDIDWPTVDGVALSYTRWLHFYRYNADDDEAYQIYYVFGTPVDSMPLSGSASYRTDISALASVWQTPIDALRYAIGGTWENQSYGTFDVNFGTGEIASTLNLTGVVPDTLDSRSFGTYIGTGTLQRDDPSFTGTFAGVDGVFGGAFFGPGAVEFGYRFHIEDGDTVIVGSLQGLRD